MFTTELNASLKALIALLVSVKPP